MPHLQLLPRAWLLLEMSLGGMRLEPRPVAVPAVAPRTNTASFDELIAQAEANRVAGSRAASARAFVAAYDALTENEKGGLKGEITVSNAVEDFQLAQEQEPDRLALLEEEAAILARLADHPARGGHVPPGLADELVRVTEEITLYTAEDADSSASLEALNDAIPTPHRELTHVASEPGPAETKWWSSAAVDGVVMGVGLACTIGGSTLASVGAWNLRHVDRRGDELLVALATNDGGTPKMRDMLRDELDRWQDRWTGIAMGLAAGGTALIVAGAGLTVWGAVRRHRGRTPDGRASMVHPFFSGHAAGVIVTGMMGMHRQSRSKIEMPRRAQRQQRRME